jgi:hypothetical protein
VSTRVLPEGTIVDFVVGNPELTLTTAVVRAGLVDTLNTEVFFSFAPQRQHAFELFLCYLNTILTNDEFIPHL